MAITNSTISGNQAATSPHEPFAYAGGIASGSFTMSNSSVSGNSATVNSDFGFALVPSGGVHIKGGTQSASITNSTISGNSVSVTGSSAFVEGRSGAGEFGGTLSNVRITGNSVDVSSATGDATAIGGASVFDSGTISNSLIGDNHLHAAAPLGAVDIRGGAVNVFGATTLRNSTVSGNTVDASGKSGSARGGGIFDGFNPDGPPGGPLVLQNSNVTANTLSGAGLLLQGGGIYLQRQPITLTNSLIAQNVPDQCFGC